METPLAKALAETVRAHPNRIRCHVPFHAGHVIGDDDWLGLNAALPYDLTELPTLDVLGNPQGVIKASQEAVVAGFGARDSFYLINGASVGLMAALLASGVTEQSTVLLARNCHRAVIHGLVLTGAKPQWLLPTTHPEWGLWGAVDPAQLEMAIQTYQPDVFVMTHPTYEGIPSDVEAIATLCKQYHVTLIVDEAHGTLWPLHPDLPVSAISAGADAVVHSLHKSGGALTQTALLHLPHGSKLSAVAVQEALNVLQTTSPSYLLLANSEATCAFLLSETGYQTIATWHQRARALRHWIASNIQSIRVFPLSPGQDAFHLFLQSDMVDGETLAELLEETHDIAFESATPYGVLLMLNGGLSDAAFERIKAVLTQLDVPESRRVSHLEITYTLPDMVLTPRQAFQASGELVERDAALGRIAKQVVATCPPGIPVVIPGERITAQQIPYLPESIWVVR